MGVYSVAFAIKDAGGSSREYVLPFNNLTATAAPGVNDDSGDGYIPGSMWVDVTNDETYFCEDNSLGAAVWKQAGGGGSVAWGDITGTLADQTDLQSALDAKQPLDTDLTQIAGLTRAKGALIVGEASNWGLLSVGTDGQQLQADSLELTGLKWVTPSSGVSGSGTMDTIPRWTSSSALGDSTITDDGSTYASVGKRLFLGAEAASLYTGGSDQNNYSLSNGTIVPFAPSANIELTGMTAPSSPSSVGQIVVIVNESSTYQVTISHNATSTAANRFYCPGGVDYPLLPQSAVIAYYDNSRWNLVGARNFSGSTGTGNVVLATSPTISTPYISDFENANHSHTGTSTGGTLSAAAIGSGTLAVARGGTGVGALQSFSAYRNTNQSIAASGWYKISMDTERWDVGSAYDPTTNYRWTPTVAGVLDLVAQFYSTDAVSNTLYGIAIYKNGSLSGGILGTLAQITATLTYFPFFAVGSATANGSSDYYEAYAYNGHGSNTLTLVGGINNNRFDGRWAGPSS